MLGKTHEQTRAEKEGEDASMQARSQENSSGGEREAPAHVFVLLPLLLALRRTVAQCLALISQAPLLFPSETWTSTTVESVGYSCVAFNRRPTQRAEFAKSDWGRHLRARIPAPKRPYELDDTVETSATSVGDACAV